MLVFLDESGDLGLRIESGSSRLFVVTAVLFETPDDAVACDRCIAALREVLCWHPAAEFHFAKCNRKFRREFPLSVAPFRFQYAAFVIDKPAMPPAAFKRTIEMYQWAAKMALETVAPLLDSATIVLDGTGNRDFRRELSAYLRSPNVANTPRIRKLKIGRSESDNLLQLADMVCGAVAKSLRQPQPQDEYRALIKSHESAVVVWPGQQK